MSNGGRSSLGLAAIVASMASGMGLSAEVIPREDVARPSGLGDWLARNNRRRVTKGEFGARKVTKRRQRLQRATGPGSYDEWKTALAAERAAKRASHV